MLRAVIDTNVLVSALRSRRGASYRLISLLGDPRWEPLISVALILEYESAAVRTAGELGLAPWIVSAIIDMICATGRNLPDPGDEFVLELAVAGQAGYIVTHNLRDFAKAETFGVRIVTPAEFLRTIGEEP